MRVDDWREKEEGDGAKLMGEERQIVSLMNLFLVLASRWGKKTASQHQRLGRLGRSLGEGPVNLR